MSYVHAPVIAGLFGLLAVLAWRIRESRRPVTLAAVVAPPLGMSTGLSMFLIPAFRIPWCWAALSFSLGAIIFAIPLMRTSGLTLEGSMVMVRRSSNFFLVIIALAAVRLFARRYIGAYLSLPQTASLSFLLAFGMIIRWRTAMYLQYKQLVQTELANSILRAQE